MEVTIITNHIYREIEYGVPEWRMDETEAELEPFFRYKGNQYFFSEIERPTSHPVEFNGWDAWVPDSYFSGIIVKFSEDGESVKVGRYYS